MTRPGAAPEDEHRLATAELTVLGRLGEASNAVFLVTVGHQEPATHGIYKPIAGERPLWDFPDGHLAHREVAAYLISAAGGWDLIPATVLREGPYGPGSLQHWVTHRPTSGDPVEDGAAGGDGPTGGNDVTSLESVSPDIVIAPMGPAPEGYLPVLTGQLPDGTPVQVAHADRDDLAALAVLDAVLNNSDRKGSHVLRDRDGGLWGVDHGVSLHADNKLRTVLWGWQGQPIGAADQARLDRLARALSDPTDPLTSALEPLLTHDEITALTDRVHQLREGGRYPDPPHSWPSVPWPPL